MLDAVNLITSPSALQAYVRQLGTYPGTPEDWSTMGARLTRSVDALRPTDRELTAIERDGDFTSSLSAVVQKMRIAGADVIPLIESVKSFFIRGMSGEMCSDSTLDRVQYKATFDQLISNAGARGKVKGFALAEIRGKIGAKADDPKVPFDEGISAEFSRLAALSDANKVRNYVADDHASIQPDEDDISEIFHREQADYANERNCELCRFEQRQGVLSTLLELLPAGSSLGRTVQEELDFLSFSSIQQRSPASWYVAFQPLLAISRKADESTRKLLKRSFTEARGPILLPSEDAPRIMRIISSASDPLIQLFWVAEAWIKPSYQPFPPISTE